MLRRPDQAVYGRDVANRAASVREHIDHDPLGQEILSADVYIIQQIEPLRFAVEKWLVERNASVVNQNVDASQASDRLLAQFQYLLKVLEIGLERIALPADRANLAHYLAGILLVVTVMNDHISPLAREFQRDS